MSDETNETSEQQPVDENAEGQTPETAGPVADGAPSSSQAAGEASETGDPAPVAEENGADAEPIDEAAAVGAEGDTPADEPQREEAPAAEAEEPVAEAPREAKKEDKKDVIPGAHLEPIAVEPDGPALSAEERARLE